MPNPPISNRGIWVQFCMYYHSIKDKKGYVHSIDNCILNYYLLISVTLMLDKIKELGINYEYWERLNCSSCPKWSFYQNHIHFDDGIYLKVGHYSDYDKKKKDFQLLPMMCVEVNPNKHHDKKSFKDLIFLIKNYCTSGFLVKYDYAVDVPVGIDDVKVFDTRKEKGLYKGTIYYGQRNKNGFCKIYNKSKERGIEGTLTRIEHTVKVGERVALTPFSVLTGNDVVAFDELKHGNKALVCMALKLRALGCDYEEEFAYLEPRKRRELEKYLNGSYEKYEYDLEIIENLLREVKKLFLVNDIEVDADGFLQFDGQSPFDI